MTKTWPWLTRAAQATFYLIPGALMWLSSGTLHAATPTTTKQATTTKAATKATRPQVHTFRYVMKFRGGKAGIIDQKMVHQPDGQVISTGHSDSLFKILFFKVKTKARFRATYRKGQLQTFTLNRVQRGKKLSVKATRTKQGYDVIHIKDGKRRRKLFLHKDFQGTVRDLSVPLGAPGTTRKRKVLNFVEFRVLKQELRFDRYATRTILGNVYKLLKVKASGPKGSLTMYVTKKGFMVLSFAKIKMLGKLEIALASLKGKALKGF